MMRWLIAFVVVAGLATRSAEACVQLQETNKLVGWSADGTLALQARVAPDGSISHAELLPTRYEGSKYVITVRAGAPHVQEIAVGACGQYISEDQHGTMTEQQLLAVPAVVAMKLVTPPADDGGASTLAARFVPRKRYAEHQLEVRDAANKVIATLPVPVWCLGSCLRDEEWKKWGATITRVATAGTRTLYVVRMARVCNGGNGEEMWIERVIAVPGDEQRPPRSRCKGSGGLAVCSSYNVCSTAKAIARERASLAASSL